MTISLKTFKELKDIIRKVPRSNSSYQKALLSGQASWSGADLRGRAKKFEWRYMQSQSNLIWNINKAIAPHGAFVSSLVCRLEGHTRQRRRLVMWMAEEEMQVVYPIDFLQEGIVLDNWQINGTMPDEKKWVHVSINMTGHEAIALKRVRSLSRKEYKSHNHYYNLDWELNKICGRFFTVGSDDSVHWCPAKPLVVWRSPTSSLEMLNEQLKEQT